MVSLATNSRELLKEITLALKLERVLQQALSLGLRLTERKII